MGPAVSVSTPGPVNISVSVFLQAVTEGGLFCCQQLQTVPTALFIPPPAPELSQACSSHIQHGLAQDPDFSHTHPGPQLSFTTQHPGLTFG